jgi:hypothetical protein
MSSLSLKVASLYPHFGFFISCVDLNSERQGKMNVYFIFHQNYGTPAKERSDRSKAGSGSEVFISPASNFSVMRSIFVKYA